MSPMRPLHSSSLAPLARADEGGKANDQQPAWDPRAGRETPADQAPASWSKHPIAENP